MNKIKIYDKADSKMSKIEASKKFMEDVSVGHKVVVFTESENGSNVGAELICDGSVQIIKNNDSPLEFYGNIYEFLLKFPVISQYQNS